MHSFLWPEGKIPYTYDPDADLDNCKNIIEEAMKTLSYKTKCITFLPWEDENDYIMVTTGTRCSSYIGRAGGKQILSLDTDKCDLSKCLHELCHAIGLIHEHQRKLRSDNVIIFWDNILDGEEKQFIIRSEYDVHNDEFDFNSIMLYEERFFSKDSRLPTIKAKNGRKLLTKKFTLSYSDICKIRKMYLGSDFN
ncbi:astacin-like metalloprotease toxin 1 [Centruroides vittatus]|uniref:astacin-like metalloprotease toxin 1 n=1 Tax=Centruroides vittatus TaxID=120091 RepID=UPI00350F0C6F